MSPFAGPPAATPSPGGLQENREQDEETFSVGTLITYSDLSFNEWN